MYGLVFSNHESNYFVEETSYPSFGGGPGEPLKFLIFFYGHAGGSPLVFGDSGRRQKLCRFSKILVLFKFAGEGSLNSDWKVSRSSTTVKVPPIKKLSPPGRMQKTSKKLKNLNSFARGRKSRGTLAGLTSGRRSPFLRILR